MMSASDFTSWLSTFLKDRGLQMVKCGSLVPRLGPSETHDINPETGDWVRQAFSSGKPPRWLYHIAPTEHGLRARQLTEGSRVIAFGNMRASDRAAALVRMLPLIRTDETGFVIEEELEALVLFVFPSGTAEGTSSETFAFDSATGVLVYKGEALDYAVAGLLGIQPRDRSFELSVGGTPHTYTYGQIVDALASSISARTSEDGQQPIELFDLTLEDEVERLKRTIKDSWPVPDDVPDQEEGEVVVQGPLEVPTNPDLVGISDSVYRQINAALQSGKQHIMLYGPPGTGKTTLARWVAASLTGDEWELITGSSDWGSQDIIGGYQPIGGGEVAFIPGVLLRNFDRPLIIDELNRCDIDKVIGPLFTVLSGQQTTLPYRMEISEESSQHYTILPESKPDRREHEYAPGTAWRIIATINSIDKASLYQMSYALSRRFGWIYVDVPHDTRGFISEFLRREDPSWDGPPEGAPCPVAEFWSVINTVRPLGPAPVIDAIRSIRVMDEDANFFSNPSPSMRQYLLDAIDMSLLPLLDGIAAQEGKKILDAATGKFGLGEGEHHLLRQRLESVAV